MKNWVVAVAALAMLSTVAVSAQITEPAERYVEQNAGYTISGISNTARQFDYN
jgi:hypothetical protein